MDDDHGEPDTLQQTPSRAQELALAILPIPSSILSIVGSSVIIYMSVSTRRQRKWTPYTRLLLCLSFYDIIASATLGMAIFLRDKDTSPRPYSFGSSGTCTMVGFFNQFSHGSLFYNGSLSLYFFLTVRFGFSNTYIARRIEPWMHAIGNGFAVTTSMLSLALGVYGEMTQGIGCWATNYPRGCKEDGSVCKSRLIGWFNRGFPFFLIFILVFIFNSMIFIFVRRHKIPPRLPRAEAQHTTKRQTARDESSSSDDDEDEKSPELRESIKETNQTDSSTIENILYESQDITAQSIRDQARRLRLLSTQAFLYVAFFLMCSVWTGVVGILESGKSTREEELQLVVDFYVFFLLEAVLAPLQGLFNMIVFIRPKLHLCATTFPRESRLWILRRTILGTRIKPTCSSHCRAPRDPSDDRRQKEPATNEPLAARLHRDMLSSVTASEGDFDSEAPVATGKDERWTAFKEKGFSSILASIPIRFESLQTVKSSLEVISENEASNFEPVSRVSVADELVMDLSSGDFFPNAETRWASGDSNSGASSTASSGSAGPIPMPKREWSTGVNEPERSNSFRRMTGSIDEIEQTKSSSADQPVKLPQRQSSTVTADADDEGQKKQEAIAPADVSIKAPVRQESSCDDNSFEGVLET